MGYIRNNLAPSERIIYETKLHWKIFVLPIILLILAGLLYWRDLYLISYLSIPLALAGLLLLGWRLLRYNTNEFAVTNYQIILKTGVFTEEATEIQLDKSTSLKVKSPFLGRIFEFGTLTYSSDTGTQAFKDVASHIKFRNKANEQRNNPQPENQTEQTSSFQSEKKEFWHGLPEFIKHFLVVRGFINIDDPKVWKNFEWRSLNDFARRGIIATNDPTESVIFYISRKRELLSHPSLSQKIQYIQLQMAEAEKEQDLHRKERWFSSTHELIRFELFDGNSENHKKVEKLLGEADENWRRASRLVYQTAVDKENEQVKEKLQMK